jgi:hypothetical protein
MTQNRDSGAAGNAFGRATGKKLAAALGATLTKPGSNEARWDGKLVVLKSASARTNSVGVTYLMLDRVEEIVAAFQRDDGSFELYRLSANAFRAEMRPTGSLGPSHGRVGVVSRSVFEAKARSLGVKRLD